MEGADLTDYLPTELVWSVLRWVGVGVARCEMVCRRWRDDLHGDAFWRSTFLISLPETPSSALLSRLTTAAEQRTRTAGGERSGWKELYFMYRLPTGVTLLGKSGSGKTALFELLRMNLSSAAPTTPTLVGVPTLEPQECVLALPSSRRLTLIDVPGRRNKGAKNFCTGIVGCRSGIVVISAVRQEFTEKHEIQDHILTTYAMGVKQLVVCITKMEHPDVYFAQSAYDEVKTYVTNLLKRMDHTLAQTHVIPISTVAGDNVFDRSAVMSWYAGPTLVEVLQTDAVVEPPSARLDSISRPPRVVVQRVYGGLSKRFDESHEGRDVVVVGGCIVAGALTVGDQVVIQPSGVGSVVVESIESHHQMRGAVFGPHESVALKLRWLRPPGSAEHKKQEQSEEEEEERVSEGADQSGNLRLIDLVGRGCVIGKSDEQPPRRVKSFTARVNVYNHPGLIRAGYAPVMRVHAATVACSFKLLDLLDKATWKVISTQPQTMRRGDSCTVQLTPRAPLCVQPHSTSADGPAGTLGRVIFADLGRMVGVGAVREAVWDTDTRIIPLTRPREDKQKLLAMRRKHRQEKWRANKSKWVQLLRSMPDGSLKITVLSAYISSNCDWVPEHCYVKVGLTSSDSSKEPISWKHTHSTGGKCQLGFSQPFIFPDVNPDTTSLWVHVLDSSRYPYDFGRKIISLYSAKRTKRRKGWRQKFSLDNTPYNLNNFITLNIYWQSP